MPQVNVEPSVIQRTTVNGRVFADGYYSTGILDEVRNVRARLIFAVEQHLFVKAVKERICQRDYCFTDYCYPGDTRRELALVRSACQQQHQSQAHAKQRQEF